MSSTSERIGSVADDVWSRLCFALPDMGIRLFGFSVMPHHSALAEYDGVQNIFYLDQLTDNETAMAVLHELGHAYLHPPGSGEFAPEQMNEDEERLVHNAAEKTCNTLGLRGYIDTMASYGAPKHLLKPVIAENRGLVDEVAAFLEAVVRDYQQPPSWPKPGLA